MTTEFEPTIGLEVHCQLGTKSKLFCSCPASSFGKPPNTSVCPICTGQPGTLPVLNKQAVELGFLAGLALGGKLRSISIFARKNYFYPDLPKGYQISQYEEPFSEGGGVEIDVPTGKKFVRLHRIHLEEDAGKLVHDIGSETLPFSLVDFNRSCVPLIEIVSEPDIANSDEAYSYLTELKAALQYLGVSNCDMEKGEMRCDANVSIKPKGSKQYGTKVEIKNLNSFHMVKDAIEHEIKRQEEVLKGGGRIAQETRLWDDLGKVTRPMRSKEEAHDYRYFPEPDLVPLSADPDWISRLKGRIPELPRARRDRFVSKLGLSDYDAGVLTSTKPLADYFEGVLKAGDGKTTPKAAANWVTGELLAKLKETKSEVSDCPLAPERLAELAGLVERGTLSLKLAKEVFQKAWDTGERPAALVEKLGLTQVSDEGALKEWAEAAVKENAQAVQDFKSGNERALGALVGAVMKKSKGKANPGKINELLKRLLK